MEEIAKSLIDTGATGLIVIVAMLFFTSLMKRQNGQKEDSLVMEFREIKPLIKSIAEHIASVDEGTRKSVRHAEMNELRMQSLKEQLDRIETR